MLFAKAPHLKPTRTPVPNTPRKWFLKEEMTQNPVALKFVLEEDIVLFGKVARSKPTCLPSQMALDTLQHTNRKWFLKEEMTAFRNMPCTTAYSAVFTKAARYLLKTIYTPRTRVAYDTALYDRIACKRTSRCSAFLTSMSR